MRKYNFNLGEIFLPKPADNREEAIKKIKAMEVNNNAINIADMINNDPDIANILNMAKIMTRGQVASADIDAQQYNIPNNIHIFDNPLDKVKENVVKGIGKGVLRGANKVYQGAKNGVEWGKEVKQAFPQIKENFTKKLNDDLNILRKWNDAFKKPSFGELEITTPRQKTDANNNITLYGQVEKTQPASKYQGYKNPLTNDNRIFTREDIGSFNTDEYSKQEPAIMAQWSKIGIPANSDLEHERLTNNGTVFVRGYTRSDGTEVKSYYRAA